MAGTLTKERWEKSVTSTCWWFTPYDDGWDGCAKNGIRIAEDREATELVRMEEELRGLPEWAGEIARGCLRGVPGCGGHDFPFAFREVVRAIGSEQAPDEFHTCFSVSRERRTEALDYCLCLDGWHAGGAPDEVAADIASRAYRHINWRRVCEDIWGTLGEATEEKLLAVEGVLAHLRRMIREDGAGGNAGDEFCRDRYLGDSQRKRHLEWRLQHSPLWKSVKPLVYDRGWWLCAPKAFRMLEHIIWTIGKGRAAGKGERVPGFLDCEDTYPDQTATAAWWGEFSRALETWWRTGRAEGAMAGEIGDLLGSATPVKRWLVRLFLHRTWLLAKYGATFGRLIAPSPEARRGKLTPT